MSAAPRFAMRGIRKAFGATVALDGVDLAVAPGEVCALVGENGAGKSTLMGILSGALRADAGEMLLDGQPYRPRDPQQARAKGVAMIYQELSLAPHLSVMENMLLGMEPGRRGLVDWKAMEATARGVLAQLEHPEIDPSTPAGLLSVAEQQLVEVGRAFAVGCRVLVLDEPTSALGRADAQRLFALIERLKGQGHAIVYISHFIEEVKVVADRFVVLRDGRTAGEGATATASHDDIVALMVGRRQRDLYARSAHRAGEPVLEVQGLAPGGATFTLHRGEVLGLAGLVGAGRTEMLRALFGLAPVRAGTVRLGLVSGPASPARRWAQGMGFVSEDRKSEGLALELSVGDNLTLTRLRGLGPGPLVLPRRRDAAARRWVERLGIRCRDTAQPVGQLSGGNQQKVALARLLHHDVDVVVLDEPTRGIDVGSKAQVYALIDALVAGAGAEGRAPKAVLMASSHLPELLGSCDRIAVMYRGVLGAPRRAEEWDEHGLMLEASGGPRRSA